MPPKKKPAPAFGRKSAYVARNRATIIDAALEVVAENGLHATMDQVAEASGMAMSTLYKHFKDKDELVITVLLEKFMEWEAKILTPTDSAAAAKNIQGILLFSVVNQLTTPKSTVADADMAIRTALSMLGLSDAKAKKLIEAKLPL